MKSKTICYSGIYFFPYSKNRILTSPIISGSVRNSTEPPDERRGFDISNRKIPGFLLDSFPGLVAGFMVYFSYTQNSLTLFFSLKHSSIQEILIYDFKIEKILKTARNKNKTIPRKTHPNTFALGMELISMFSFTSSVFPSSRSTTGILEMYSSNNVYFYYPESHTLKIIKKKKWKLSASKLFTFVHFILYLYIYLYPSVPSQQHTF